MEEGDAAPLGEKAWGEARLPVPAGAYVDVLTGARHEAATAGLRVADLLARFPGALLRTGR
jgi:maltooligosyltrehalose synthase